MRDFKSRYVYALLTYTNEILSHRNDLHALGLYWQPSIWYDSSAPRLVNTARDPELISNLHLTSRYIHSPFP